MIDDPVVDRDDLIIVAMQHQVGHFVALEAIGEVGLREGLDAAVI